MMISSIARSSATFAASAALLVALAIPASAQSSGGPFSGFSLELGLGHNALFWSVPEEGTSLDRDRLLLAPTVRLSHDLLQLGPVSLVPFIGYNEFGGRSGAVPTPYLPQEGAIYEDRFRFQNAEAGTFVLVSLPQHVRLGVGAKVNRHLRITQHSRVTHPEEVGAGEGWGRSDAAFWFRSWSVDGALRADWLPADRLRLGIEGWRGVSPLASQEARDHVEIRQHHFRIVAGLTF